MHKLYKKKRGIVCILCVFVLAMLLSFSVAAETPYNSYTYWKNDRSVRKLVSNRPMFEPVLSIGMDSFAGAEFERLSDVAVDENGMIYLLDSGKGELFLYDKEYHPVLEIKNAMIEGKAESFAGAKGIFAIDGENIFIADTKNARVLIMNQQGSVKQILTLPDSELIPDGFDYKPSRITVDNRGYIYVLSEGSYYGALIYETDYSFGGFFGSNRVYGPTIGIVDRLKDRLFNNNEKRSGQMLKLPYQFTDLVADKDGYIYTITGRTSNSTQSGQIKRLNAAGSNILVNSEINFADEGLLTLLKSPVAQDLLSLAVDDEGFVYALDSSFGKIFVYDVESNLLTAFGGGLSEGEQIGTFKQAVSIEVTGEDVLVVDSTKKSLTVFRINQYGRDVKNSQLMSMSGYYLEAKPQWEAILEQDRGNQLAYQALAQAEIIEGNYDKAMEYAKIADNRELYSQAFQYVRSKTIRSNFFWIFPLALVIILLLTAVIIYTTHHKLVLVRNRTIKEFLSASIHPFKVFESMKEEKRKGSILICFLMILLFYVSNILTETKSGFLFSPYDPATFNSFLVLLKTIGLVFLWVIVNWLISSLFEGKGTFGDILTVTCYGLLPIVIVQLIALYLSQIFLLEEGAFLQLFRAFGVIYSLLLITVGTMIMHSFSLKKFVGTGVLTLFGIVIVVFVIFMLVILLQQGYNFVVAVFSEAVYR